MVLMTPVRRYILESCPAAGTSDGSSAVSCEHRHRMRKQPRCPSGATARLLQVERLRQEALSFGLQNAECSSQGHISHAYRERVVCILLRHSLICRERTVEGFNQRRSDSILGRGRPQLRHRRDISESYFAISYLSVTACAFNSPDTALARASHTSHTSTEASPCFCTIYPQLPRRDPQSAQNRHAVCSETPADPVRQGV